MATAATIIWTNVRRSLSLSYPNNSSLILFIRNLTLIGLIMKMLIFTVANELSRFFSINSLHFRGGF